MSAKSDSATRQLAAPFRCPTCNSPKPTHHPVGEARCPDGWHRTDPAAPRYREYEPT